MAETQAASSPAEMADPFNGQTPTLVEFNSYRQSGEVPERFKPEAESAPADAPEQTAEPGNAPDPEPEDAQEHQREIPPAEKRIKQLLAEKKELERKLAAKSDEKPAPSAEPQTASSRKKPDIQDKKPDGTPVYTTYEAFVEDLGRYSAEQVLERAAQQQVQQSQTQKVQENIESARKRYGDEFESVIEPAAAAINGNQTIPLQVKVMLAGSDVLPELLYTIGSDPATLKEVERLSKSNPTQAMRYIATLEVGIRQELAAESEIEAPEPRKTSAPKPPAPVERGNSRAFDVSDDSLSPEEWMRKRNAQVARRQRP
jgi:hypothetical protein